MFDQAEEWSKAAADYERHFVDPYSPHANNPMLRVLERVKNPESLVVADVGCGTGPLLSVLAQRFGQVVGIDYAEGMLRRARERCVGLNNVEFVHRTMLDLTPWHGQFDIITSVNSLVLSSVADLDLALRQFLLCLKPGGRVMGVVPAMDSVHYLTTMFLDQALTTGKPLSAAKKHAAYKADHECYDFAFGQFRFRSIEQHFWQAYEVPHRLRKAGFRAIKQAKVRLPWEQFVNGKEMDQYEAPWDWFFHARRPRD